MPKSIFVDPAATRAPGKITFEDIPVNAYNKTVAEERKKFSDDDLVRIWRDITILREFESMLNQSSLMVRTKNYDGSVFQAKVDAGARKVWKKLLKQYQTLLNKF